MSQTNQLPHQSRHLFLFPFRWTIHIHPAYQKKRNKASSEQILNDFENLLVKQNDRNWERKPFGFTNDSTEPALAYNEYTYFYDFARSSLYDTKADKGEPINYYEYVIGPNARFKLKAYKKEETYDLALTGISLHVFDTGVAVLTYSLLNTQYDSADDILLINQLGRRLYPEFLGQGNQPLVGPLGASYLAEYIILELDAPATNPRTIHETFCSFQTPVKLWSDTGLFSVPMPAYVTDLFPDTIFSFSKADEAEQTRHTPDGPLVRFQQIMDDRMFVLCWYGTDEWANKLKAFNKEPQTFAYENDKFWYAFLFCDSSKEWPTCTHPRMFREHIQEATYERWAGYGTLFGLTRDTFMVLTQGQLTLQALKLPIDHHVYQIYYQFIVLCLVQRASLLQFKMHVGALSKKVRQTKKGQLDEQLVDEVGQLYLRYLDFINRLFYREITSQIQGDELYNKLQKQMRLREEVEVLDREISELHDHIETMQTRDISRAINILVPLTIVSLVFSFIGMDKLAFPYPLDTWDWSWQYGYYILLLVLVTLVSTIFATTILGGIRRLGLIGPAIIKWLKRRGSAVKKWFKRS